MELPALQVSSAYCFSNRPKVLPGVNCPGIVGKFYFKNCLANSYSDVLDKILSLQAPPEGSSLLGCGKQGMLCWDSLKTSESFIWSLTLLCSRNLCRSVPVAHLRPVINSTDCSQLMLQGLCENHTVDLKKKK